MKKILIFYGSFGGGHLSAARNIKEYINLNYPDMETLLVDCIEYVNKSLNRITTKAYADMARNAHHRINETNTVVEKMETKITEINKKVDNLGINLAKKDERDKKWRRWIVVIGCLALAAFVGMFIQDSEIRKGIGEIALRIGVGMTSAI